MKPTRVNSRARDAALRQYGMAHESFSEREQIAVFESRMAEAAGEHAFANWALRAYRVELDDPKPPPPALAPCGACPPRQCDLCLMCRKRAA